MCQCATHDLIIPNDKNHEKNKTVDRLDQTSLTFVAHLWIVLRYFQINVADTRHKARAIEMTMSSTVLLMSESYSQHMNTNPPLALILVYRTVILSAPVIAHSLFLSRCFEHFSTTISIKFRCARKT